VHQNKLAEIDEGWGFTQSHDDLQCITSAYCLEISSAWDVL